MTKKSEIEKRICEVLDGIRQYLQIDKGDVEFVRYEEDTKVVELRLTGKCKDCPMSVMTLRAGIERFILKAVPEVNRIEQVN